MIRYKLKESEESNYKDFQKERITAFDEIIRDIEMVRDSLLETKQKTIQYYKQNPDSFEVLYSTDIIKDYLNDIKTLLK